MLEEAHFYFYLPPTYLYLKGMHCKGMHLTFCDAELELAWQKGVLAILHVVCGARWRFFPSHTEPLFFCFFFSLPFLCVCLLTCSTIQLKEGRTWNCGRSSSWRMEPLRAWLPSGRGAGDPGPHPGRPRPVGPRPCPVRPARPPPRRSLPAARLR